MDSLASEKLINECVRSIIKLTARSGIIIILSVILKVNTSIAFKFPGRPKTAQTRIKKKGC